MLPCASIAVWLTHVPELFQLGVIESMPTASVIELLNVTGAPMECEVAVTAPIVGAVKSLGPVHVSETTTLSENKLTW